jgi:DNA-binding transcriptional ArsR family regulator
MNWTFLTNHGHVLIILSRNAGIRISELADEVGISERQVSNILKDLYDSGYVTKQREGRRNRYAISSDAPLRHQSNQDHTVSELIKILGDK